MNKHRKFHLITNHHQKDFFSETILVTDAFSKVERCEIFDVVIHTIRESKMKKSKQVGQQTGPKFEGSAIF